MKISDNTAISMPVRNLLGLIAAIAVGIWAYFGIIERLNSVETRVTIYQKQTLQKTRNFV
jgi:hypothetical protein